MQHIPPLVYSAVALVDPAITGIISWLVGLEHIPNVVIWIGGCIIVGGVCTISYGEHIKELSPVTSTHDKNSTMNNNHSIEYHAVSSSTNTASTYTHADSVLEELSDNQIELV